LPLVSNYSVSALEKTAADIVFFEPTNAPNTILAPTLNSKSRAGSRFAR